MLNCMAFGLLTFFPRPCGRIKLLQPGCCKVKVSEIEISRTYQGYRDQMSRSLCNFIGPKGTYSTIYDLFTHKYSFYTWHAINLLITCM